MKLIHYRSDIEKNDEGDGEDGACVKGTPEAIRKVRVRFWHHSRGVREEELISRLSSG